MARATVDIYLDNAAFDDDFEGEIEAVMDQAKEKLIAMEEGYLRDSNGNTVGEVFIEDEDEESEWEEG